MKTSLCLLLFTLSALPGLALVLPAKPPTPPSQTSSAEVILTGVLQRRLSIGGETTGWVLRSDQHRTIELTFTREARAPVREGAWVACTGTYETRHFPERGNVCILVVRAIHEVVT